MDKEEKKQKLIEARAILSQVFNASQENWNDGWWCSSMSHAMGLIDDAIRNIDEEKPKSVGYIL